MVDPPLRNADAAPADTGDSGNSGDSASNVYQLAGLDGRGRGFNRQIRMTVARGTCRAIFQYETFLLETEPQTDERASLAALLTQLQRRGYTQLRSRLQFRGAEYLGNQEPWDEHQDPETPGRLTTWLHSLRHMFRRPRRQD